jgi:hypothetical protein
MDNREQNLISDALAFAHLTKLPKKGDPEKGLWIEAIAKFRLANNSVGYGVVKRNLDLSYRVLYINGSTASIVDIEEAYPYIMLEKQYIKKFTEKAGEKERIAYLESLNLPYVADGYFDGMSIDELNKEVVKAAVYQQLKALEK